MSGRKVTVGLACLVTVLFVTSIAAPTAEAARARVKVPAKVTDVRAGAITTSAATISWKNPRSGSFRATIVRIATGLHAPRSIRSGRFVAAVGKRKHAVRITRLAPDTTYSVSLFSSGGKRVSKAVPVRIHTKAVPKRPSPTTGQLFGVVRGVGNTSLGKGVLVTLFDGSGFDLDRAVANERTGGYSFDRLPAGSYTVCARVEKSTNAAVPGGWVRTCFNGATWDRASDPATNATYSKVRVGKRTVMNLVLPRGGAIAGSVQNATGYPVSASVALFDANRRSLFVESADVASGYDLVGLPAGKYFVCFDPDDPMRYPSACNDNVAWDGARGRLPDGATTVTVTTGRTTTLDAVLHEGGSISGKVSNSTGVGVKSSVLLFDHKGKWLQNFDQTDDLGAYTIPHLFPGTYYLCFAPEGPYANQCYDGVTQVGDPSGPLPTGVKPIVMRTDEKVRGKNATVS